VRAESKCDWTLDEIGEVQSKAKGSVWPTTAASVEAATPKLNPITADDRLDSRWLVSEQLLAAAANLRVELIHTLASNRLWVARRNEGRDALPHAGLRY